MKISIITINRNNAAGLGRTLRSIARQLKTLSPERTIEHIVVDGQSTDQSLHQLLPELNSQVIIAPPKGIYNAINLGIKQSTGDIIGLLHSGDAYIDDDILQTLAEHFETNPGDDFVWGDIIIGLRQYGAANFSPRKLTIGFAPPHPSLYLRRHVIDRIGLYNETYTTAADFEYFVRLFTYRSFTGSYLPLTMVKMQPGGTSQKFLNRLWLNNTERLRALSRHGLPANRLRLLAYYPIVLKGFICSSKKK